jgi:hypothetical protein
LGRVLKGERPMTNDIAAAVMALAASAEMTPGATEVAS